MEENEPLLQPAIFQAILNKPILVDYNHALEKLDEADLKTQLEQSLQQLPKRCREIFWMSRIEHLSNDEIAQQLSISKRTVENQITHALKHLRLIRGPLFTIMLCTLFQKFL